MLQRSDLYPYQRKIASFITEHENTFAMVDMGLGKTVSGLTAFLDLYESFEARRMLVIAPVRVAQRVWSDEVQRWAHLRGLTVARIVGTPKQRMAALRTPADVHTINREQIPWLEAQFFDNGGKQTMRWPWDLVMNDESQGFKSQSAQRFKSLYRMRWGPKGQRREPLWPRMVNLSGTPAPNGLRGLWAQYRLLDNGRRLGTAEGAFQERFFLPPKAQYAKWELRDKAEEEIHRLIGDITISMKAEDYLDLPPVKMNYIRVSMPDRVRAKYKELENKYLTELFSGTSVTAANAGVCTGKLCQLANGAIYTGEAPGAWEALHDEKLRALPEVIDSANGNPVLLVYSYKHDLARMAPVLDEMGVQWRLLVKDADFDLFRDGLLDVGVLHPASAGHGLNDLHLSGAETLIHFGLTNNLELYQQVNARLIGGHRRVGKNVVIHHIVCDKTIDEDLIDLLEAKDYEQYSLTRALAKRHGQHI